MNGGWVAWGNGEPCPYCGKPFEKASVQHLFDEHMDELEKTLFLKGASE